MENKDYLQREIDKLANAIAYITGKLSTASYDDEKIETDFNELLDISFVSFLSIEEDDLLSFLSSKNLSKEAIEKLALFLYHYDKRYFMKKKLFDKISFLYSYLNINHSTISYEFLIAFTNLKNKYL